MWFILPIREKIETLAKIENKLKYVSQIASFEVLPDIREDKILNMDYRLKTWNDTVTSHIFYPNELEDAVSYLFQEKYVRTVKSDSEVKNVYLRYDSSTLGNSENLNNLPIFFKDKIIPLKALIKTSESVEHNNLYKDNGQEIYQIDIWSKDNSKLQLENIIRKTLSEDNSINRNSWSFLPVDLEIEENLYSLMKALLLSLVLIFLILTFQFSKISHVLTIMSAIPLGIIGVGMSLYFFDSVLSVNSILGLILLSGTAVNNSILIVDHYNKASRLYTDFSKIELVLFVMERRIRPIMITTITTIIGMLPLALIKESGGEVLRPLGLAICGGLSLSTFFVIFVVPTLLCIDIKSKKLNV